jgi:hypothetical protein
MVREQMWAAVPGFPGYEASTHGRIRTWSRGDYSIIRKPHKAKKDGYLRINLGGGRSARRKTMLVHRLVWLSWHGTQEPDGDDGR